MRRALMSRGRSATPCVMTTWPPMKVVRKLSFSTRMRSASLVAAVLLIVASLGCGEHAIFVLAQHSEFVFGAEVLCRVVDAAEGFREVREDFELIRSRQLALVRRNVALAAFRAVVLA